MEKIAIIGFSCLFPDAKTPDDFWQNLLHGKDSTSSVTAKEIGVDPEIFYEQTKGKPDKIYSLKGAFIRDFQFDATGYQIPPEFLETLDNTFKWSLYTAKEALQHSGYLNDAKNREKCGVILGALSLPTKYSNQIFAPMYQQVLTPAIKELLHQKEFTFPSFFTSGQASNHNAMISGLPAAVIAKALSLSNINFCIDAACSSPLYSIKLASHYLWTHKADLMLAGGISCSDPLFLRMLFSGIQAYPEDNDISRPFDKNSRGIMTAEGAGMFVLKRYSDAVRDGDKIYATILGNGLSNDGKGKHLLSPSAKGQILSFERAYKEAQINPQDIDYLECHATGTLLGDTTEFNSIETFFSQHQAQPLVGAVKANVGHLLVGAGGVSLMKVLLSMAEGVIPATININESVGTSSNIISSESIVRSNTPWLNKNSVKRAAISAFGFGGTNAHMIVEQGSTSGKAEADEPLQPAKMAIVGMDAFFGGCNGLDAFERSIYEGKQQFIPLPENRWTGIENVESLLKQYNLPEGKAPIGAYIQDFELDTLSSKIPPNELDKLNPQQLLLLKVAERALKDASIKEGGNVAVIIAAETEFSVHQLQQRWNLSWQIKEGLNAGEICLPSDKIAQLETIVKDGIHHPVELSEFVSYISNVMASRISSLWDFSGATFTISSGENSTFKALEIAQHLLTTGEADAVLVGAVDLAGGLENVLLRSQQSQINTGVNTLAYDQKANGWTVGEGAGAVVLKRYDSTIKQANRIYAVIDAISFDSTVSQTCQTAFNQAGIQPGDVNYLEVYGSGIPEDDEAEIQGLLKGYSHQSSGLNCALGSVKSNIGHTYVASGIASLIKTALCVYYKYIPAVPKWTGVKHQDKNQELWKDSHFYVATESRPWLLSQNITRRVAAINGMGMDGTYAHLILSEQPNQETQKNRYLQQMPLYLFPIAADTRSHLLEELGNLQNSIKNTHSLAAVASQTFAEFQNRQDAKFAIAILGRNQKELAREIESAFKGIKNAFELGEEWQTPLGSYFTAKPQGKVGEVAFVYPAAINSFVGIARDLGRLFPKVHDDIVLKSIYAVIADIEKLLYPRSLDKLTTRQLETIEKQLLDNALVMLQTEMGIARIFTIILQDYFQVKPKFAFGYSLGETSMMSAQGVWNKFEEGLHRFNSSPLFGDRLSGAKNALREYWSLPPIKLEQFDSQEDKNLWGTYVLMATAEQVQEAVKSESRAYLTQISTPEEVVIAGEPAACQRVIKTLGCNAFSAPFNHLIHCDPMGSEYNELVKLHTLESQNISDVAFYSSADYAPIKLESEAIAHSVAKCLTTQLDFPRLVNQVYQDGARIFIETGAGTVCSRWIEKILQDKDHLCVALNRRGADDHSSVIKGLAKLASHRVAVDLSSLYPELSEIITKPKVTVKKVSLGGDSITSKILTEENKKLFQDIDFTVKQSKNTPLPEAPQLINLPPVSTPPPVSPVMQDENTLKNFVSTTHNFLELSPSSESIATITQTSQPIASEASSNLSNTTLEKITNTASISEYKISQCQAVSENNSKLNQAHAAFLNARNDSSKQMSEIIQLQFLCVENLLSD
jgi:PfaB family protein